VLEFRATSDGYRLVVDGLAGRCYEVTLLGEPIGRVAGAEIVAREGARTRVRIAVPSTGAATGRVTVALVR
jgi:hypothetical protein